MSGASRRLKRREAHFVGFVTSKRYAPNRREPRGLPGVAAQGTRRPRLRPCDCPNYPSTQPQRFAGATASVVLAAVLSGSQAGSKPF